jgi:hypothetical protein
MHGVIFAYTRTLKTAIVTLFLTCTRAQEEINVYARDFFRLRLQNGRLYFQMKLATSKPIYSDTDVKKKCIPFSPFLSRIPWLP